MRLQWFTANAAAGHVTQIMNLRTERNRMEWNVAWPWMEAHSALCLSSLTPAAAAAAAPTPTPIAMAAGNGSAREWGNDTLITDYRLPITDYGSWLTDQQSKQEDLLSCPFIMVWLGQMYCDLVDLLFALLSLELVILRMSFYLVQFTLNRSFPFNINLKS